MPLDSRLLREQYLSKKENLALANNHVKQLKEELAEIEEQLMEAMDEIGTENLALGNKVFIIAHRKVATLTDWEAFSNYVVENDAMHLVHRRVTNQAAIDMIEGLGSLPGIDLIELRSINVRNR